MWTDVTQASQVILQSLPMMTQNIEMYSGLVCCHSSVVDEKPPMCISPWTDSLSAALSVLSVGPGVTQREDLAWLQRAARCEEDDFHRVSLQQPAKALWSTALRPRL